MLRAFPQPTPTIPLVGQPCTVQGFFVTVMVQCNCEAKTPLLLVAQSVVRCGACGHGYRVKGITHQAGEAPSITLDYLLDSQVR